MAISNSGSLKHQTIISEQSALQYQVEKVSEFQTLVENTKVMLLIFQDKQICYANPIAKMVTGYNKEELLVNTNLAEQLQIESNRQIVELRDHAVTQERQVNFLTKNGKQCWLDCSIRKIQFFGNPAILVTAIDITRYKETELRIQQILEREKKLISMISHELRTPLNVISFSSRLLTRYGDRWKPAKVKEYLERLQRGVDTLSLLIDEWLILGKVEGGKLKFQPKSEDLEQFCGNLLSDLQLEESQPRINFCSQGDCSSVWVDRRILQLILTNLLENALKYSLGDRKIDFVVVCEPKQVTFTIKDRGIGIKQSDRHKLFEPFYRGENVDTIPGHGLGLAIVKKLVDLHHGQITVDSEIGVGTEFRIAFPRLQTD